MALTALLNLPNFALPTENWYALRKIATNLYLFKNNTPEILVWILDAVVCFQLVFAQVMALLLQKFIKYEEYKNHPYSITKKEPLLTFIFVCLHSQ